MNPAKRDQDRTEDLVFTSRDKVMFPDIGGTKGDILDYYDRISDWLLPYLQDRPMTLERLPDGLVGTNPPHFWQKNAPDYYPDWIPRITIASDQGDQVDYVLINSRHTLLYLVNQGAITFHPWMSRCGSLDKPDYVLFDLDPGQRAFSDAVIVAKHLHRILDERQTQQFVKTSGKSGLHVMVPWKSSEGYDVALEWAFEIANAVATDLPEIATTERSKQKRKERLYIDVMQNIRGHHVVPPYVLRPTPRLTVSTPLKWNELTPDLTPAKFTIRTIFRRLGQLQLDPMADLL